MLIFTLLLLFFVNSLDYSYGSQQLTDDDFTYSTEKAFQVIEEISKNNDESKNRSTEDRDNYDSSVSTKGDWYPTYHLSPPKGWMNDPNGLIEFKGYYHAFYQHNPSEPVWGDMHWGHARSKNLIEWEHLPVALGPSIDEDRDGCFSGSAVDDRGTLTLIYTGNVFLENDQLHQVTCLATSNDTINFTKLGKVMDPPKGVQHFRDPKAWRADNRWYVVMGTRDGDLGEAHLYQSEDLRQWEFVQVLAKADIGQGYMWECPDFFPIDDKYLLVLSPQGMPKIGYKNRNLYQSGYFLGKWNSGDYFQIEQNFTEMDNGHDFYAPQTFLTSDGRRIVVGWMDMWESPFPENVFGWSGMFSLPRELTLAKDGTLLIEPVREIEDFRGKEDHLNRTVLNKSFLKIHDDATAMEIVMTWDVKSSDAETYGLRLGDANLTDGGLYLYVDTQARRLTLDRRYLQHSLSGYRSIPLTGIDTLSLRVFLDHSSVEVFVDGGRKCMSSRIYPEKDQRELSVFANNGQAVLENCSWWPIKVDNIN
ncbi:sucrose-6-phosphate hydrolase-like [Argiope bruennichi]|uniref:sucrose-6-phosphate hydrolase-like n=1 Tax=Argiope bruennichi TaxID=94029 RepID=UPI002494BF92|nr:sucrose-6-phosphate hydrolase-like [Argiope bruennichi]